MTEVTPLPIPDMEPLLKGVWEVFWPFMKFLWPLWLIILALIVLKLILWKLDDKIEKWKLNKIMKKCPQCTEMVPIEAKKCKFCGSDV